MIQELAIYKQMFDRTSSDQFRSCVVIVFYSGTYGMITTFADRINGNGIHVRGDFPFSSSSIESAYTGGISS